MKNNKKKILCFLTTFLLLFTYISFLVPSSDVYAQNNNQYIVAKSYSSSKPSSGSFKSGGSSSKSYSTKPKTSIIKPDSGGFSTKPNATTTKPNTNSSIKPDSGSFTNKPNNSSSENNSNNNNDTSKKNSGSGYGGGNYRPIFGNRGFYGFSNPFYGMMHGFRMSSWITKLVTIIMVIVIAYIVIDFIRSRRK